MKLVVRSAAVVVLAGLFATSLCAQDVELYPNAGGVFPMRMDQLSGNKFKGEGIYGLKGGVFIGQNVQIEGSFGYLNHFELKNPPNSFNPGFGVVQPTT